MLIIFFLCRDTGLPTLLTARPTFNQPAELPGVRAKDAFNVYRQTGREQLIHRTSEIHCTSFTGVLVVDCIIKVGEISVPKLPISRPRNAHADAQQERKCRRDFHPF